ncbi:N-acetyltransferase [Flavobacterium columnare]|uniref:N-acetyltransferase GCN5 n=2 Tax=Flavobacterium columnare TaxID=996 RepID=G8X5L0_FLACA|nr:GNAT family N-acetyltransferase [Flavobacterium columnare]AEW86854.1 N-acetyltransferase GCN5 [Flavobacterium columnare ATCC 49512]AMO20769.1 GNAT family N-acetyltransferase [Flavobacterium columnare]ANO47280.1 N-acetyltransferase GCN5 [Flavobacterium columnare]APT22054.1 N-acetyltransferase [Flavobacterium columnare]AUX18754.1 GNAT family acetyltransferase [Flavobacterium columnare]
MRLLRSNSDHPDFKYLTKLFDEYLVDIDGEQKDFFTHFNNKYLENVLIVYEDDQVVGCGGYKEHTPNTVEIKRMFVHPEHRKKGIANLILNTIEDWAKQKGYQNFILETSPKLTNAISLYEKKGYKLIPNYDQYIGVENSICMKKES